jgi:hypothetical protein
MPHDTVSRRHLLAVGGVVAVGSLAGCLNRVASAVTNTGASPAAAFAGTQAASVGEFVVGEPHVSRLTPTVSGGQLGDVELEGWVTSSPVMAQDYNSSRSNKQRTRSADGDADGDGLGDADEDDELAAYLGGEPIVAERFTVCLPAAEVPGGNGSIREAVTPERLVAYLTGEFDGEGQVYSWGTPEAGSDGGGDCDDNEREIFPAAVCGTTPHFVAEVTGPTATGGSLELVRGEGGTVTVVNTPPTVDDKSAKVCVAADDDPCGPGVWARTTESGAGSGVSVYQVMVQPPRCPKPFPALLYVQRCESNDQLVYTGGWVIDDAALYEDSVTVLSMAGPTEVVGVELSDLGSSFEDVAGGPDWESPRVQQGARLDSGTLEELVETGVLSEQAHDLLVAVASRGGETRGDDGEPGENYRFVAHVSVDAPVLHLASASRASQDVKFKAGAELSKAVN